MEAIFIIFDKKKRKKLSNYFFYIFKEPGVEASHFRRIIVETVIVLAIFIYYLVSFNFKNWYYLLFIIFYIYELVHFYQKFRNSYFKKSNYVDYNFGKNYKLFRRLRLNKKQKDNGWKIKKYFNDRQNAYALYSDRLNQLLIEDVQLYKYVINKAKHGSVKKYIKDYWQNHSIYLQYKVIQSFVKNKDFFNDKKVCLGSDLDGDNKIVDIYFGTYFDSILTNEACGSIYENTITGKRTNQVVIESFTNKSQILELSASKCNNHIGVSTLAITKDAKIVIWTQNSMTQQNTNLFIPTASGSLDQNDIYVDGVKSDSLMNVIINGANRELCEENTIAADKILQTRLIGFWRWIERGAKPEFVCISLLNIDASELQADSSEIKQLGENETHIIDVFDEDLENMINKLIKNKRSSLPLVVSLSFFKDFTNNEELFNSFVKNKINT